MSAKSIVSPHDQSVTFVELFFDLVFVFSVTQLVGLLAHDLDLAGAGRVLLVAWLVWWAWTQFTWALNAADTTHPAIELATLLATAVAFFLGVTLPGVFSGGALWFALAYVAVRAIGLAVYIRVSWVADPNQHAAVRRFAAMSLAGLGAVIGGAIAGGSALLGLWALAIVLDFVATSAAESEGWDLHPDHFAERHGLFVIIALGESLIVAAAGLSDTVLTSSALVMGTLAALLGCALWWTYFASAKPSLDRRFEHLSGRHQALLARDAFSLLHFPMVLGVLGAAAAVEVMVAHPHDLIDLPVRAALGLGIALFTGGMAIALWRAGAGLRKSRLLAAVATAAALLLVGDVSPLVGLAIALTGVALIALAEFRMGSSGSSFELAE